MRVAAVVNVRSYTRLRTGSARGAVETAERAVSIDRYDPGARLLLAQSSFAAGDRLSARRKAAWLSRWDPTEPAGHGHRLGRERARPGGGPGAARGRVFRADRRPGRPHQARRAAPPPLHPTADNVEKRTSADSSLSFPSGHTAFTGAVRFSTAAVLVHSREVEPWAAYGGAGLLTAGMGGLRVLAGRHYPTDVLVGGAIGAAVGISTVSLHERAGADPAEAGVPRGSTGRRPGMVLLSGVW